MAPKNSELERLCLRLMRADPPRSKSLILTIFGDSLLPHVSQLWLADLITLLEPLGVNAQLARTSAFRLAAEGWLASRREGRSSLYSLTQSGESRVRHAYSRIYDPPVQQWDGEWTILIPGEEGSSIRGRTALRQELEWAGFGRINARLFLHPCPDVGVLNEILVRLHLSDDVVSLRARDLDASSSLSTDTFPSGCWDLPRVAAHYHAFLKHIRPVLPMLGRELKPKTAFVLQTLLIHRFRRVALHDPRLPATLLPEDWPGHEAYEVCRHIYQRTHVPVARYLSETLAEAEEGRVLPSPGFFDRFGGLR